MNWVAVQLELAGLDVTTERRMRQAERLGQHGRWSIQMTGNYFSDRQRTHRPDLIVRMAEARIPVEVELTRKSRRRLKELMTAWARQSSYGQVIYLCGSAALNDLVAEQALRVGADLVVRSGVCGARGEGAGAELLRLLDATCCHLRPAPVRKFP